MKKTSNITLIILLIGFVASFFTPAYSGLLGYECVQEILDMLSLDEKSKIFWVLYYQIFHLDNLLTCFFFFALYFRRALSMIALKWIGGLSAIHILSWLFMHYFFEDAEGLMAIEVGYYLWAFSMISIWVFYCRIIKSGSQNFDSVK